MGFKKATKKKVKKAPGKKGRKDGWDFEGGTFNEEVSKTEERSADGSKTREGRCPRKTQERDEYIRRGRAKIEDRKKKWQMEKKMSKKISFNDILNGDDQVVQPTVIRSEEVAVKKLYKKSTKSVMERLQHYVNADLTRTFKAGKTSTLNEGGKSLGKMEEEEDEDSSGDVEDEVEVEEEEEYEMDAGVHEDLNGEDEENDAEMDEDAIMSHDEEDIHSELDNEEMGNDMQKGSNGSKDDFDWLFNPVQKSSSIMKKDNEKKIVDESYRNDLQQLSAFDDFQLYGALNPAIDSRQRTPILRYLPTEEQRYVL